MATAAFILKAFDAKCCWIQSTAVAALNKLIDDYNKSYAELAPDRKEEFTKTINHLGKRLPAHAERDLRGSQSNTKRES
ncbi:MAG: hypothetical protein FWG10_06585 [Eubacteriaceae bacterium]|nr:hypothetical protein [Eubacteriaceae bacterium]